jgi:hypothetical protein
VLLLLSLLSAVVLAIAWSISPPLEIAGGYSAWFAAVLVNLGAGVVGSVVTFYLIDLRLNRERERQTREEARLEMRDQRAREDRNRLNSLLSAVRSQSADEARVAIEELRTNGWLYDGALRETDLSGADLRGLNLSRAQLSGCVFRGCDLRLVDFSSADLTGCVFDTVDIRGWTISHALLDGATYVNVMRDE